jgi:hypothetical protein
MVNYPAGHEAQKRLFLVFVKDPARHLAGASSTYGQACPTGHSWHKLYPSIFEKNPGLHITQETLFFTVEMYPMGHLIDG